MSTKLMFGFLIVIICLSCGFLFSTCQFGEASIVVSDMYKDHRIQMYSGGEVVQTWTTKSRIVSVGAGYSFVDEDNRKIRVSGTIVIDPI